MTLFDALLLGGLQGLTEFLPISSSGHLVLAEYLLKLPVENLKSFDIAVHFGTMLAIVVYFWKDVVFLWKAFWDFLSNLLSGKKPQVHDQEVRKHQSLLVYLIVGTIPAVILALLFADFLDENFRHPFSVAVMLIIVGALFFVAEYIFQKMATRQLTLRQAFTMGLAQALALIPGVSRSGITISAGLMQGIKRDEAARFSFLLGGITILAATLYGILSVLKGKYSLPATDILLVGIASSFLFGLGAISFLMRFLKKHTLHVFGIYRIVLGVVLIYLIGAKVI
jgi:undecaprenyl-diphosphatase